MVFKEMMDKKTLNEMKMILDSMPEVFKVLEVGIPIPIQEAYLEYAHGATFEEIPNQDIQKLKSLLFNEEVPESFKKKALTHLAHAGNVEAFKLLQLCYQEFEGELQSWSVMALQECIMLIESELMGESMGFISTGLGGTGNKLRIYFLVLPLLDQKFNPYQHHIIEDEISQAAKVYNCEIERFTFNEYYVGFLALIPMDIAIATFIDYGILACNANEKFVLDSYYAGNTEIPDSSEIEDIIKIIREE